MMVKRRLEPLEPIGAGYELAEKPVAPPASTCTNDCNVAKDEDQVVFSDAPRPGLLGLVELILKDRTRLHRVIRDPSTHAEVIPQFVAVSLVGFAFYGIAMSVVLHAAGRWPQLADVKDWLTATGGRLILFDSIQGNLFTPWLNGAALKLIAAYAIGLVAATGVCMPSLYFYGLLSGIRMSLVEVTVHALKSKATTAVALVGILPIYAAVSMGMVVIHAPPELLEASLYMGLMLPFVAGLWGTTSLYVGFANLCDRLPANRRTERACFLRRLVLSWAACYTAVMPVMIYTLWESLGT